MSADDLKQNTTIRHSLVDAMNELANYYKDIKDDEEMKKYYLMAIE